jgi:hypothetical protein
MKGYETVSTLCRMAGFGISSVESSGREVVKDIEQYVHDSILFYYCILK